MRPDPSSVANERSPLPRLIWSRLLPLHRHLLFALILGVAMMGYYVHLLHEQVERGAVTRGASQTRVIGKGDQVPATPGAVRMAVRDAR